MHMRIAIPGVMQHPVRNHPLRCERLPHIALHQGDLRLTRQQARQRNRHHPRQLGCMPLSVQPGFSRLDRLPKCL